MKTYQKAILIALIIYAVITTATTLLLMLGINATAEDYPVVNCILSIFAPGFLCIGLCNSVEC